jgi:hypothetical protein
MVSWGVGVGKPTGRGADIAFFTAKNAKGRAIAPTMMSNVESFIFLL